MTGDEAQPMESVEGDRREWPDAQGAGESRWWLDPTVVQHTLAGVFEGGGAKGAAYVGALRATRAKGCWFGAVAGASAGAITAGLIAAGLTVEELETQSVVAFDKLGKPSKWRGFGNLRNDFGWFNLTKVHEWLEQVLQGQVRRFGISVPGPVTFATLYAATEIELNVVAADVSRGRQIVFSVWDTPGAQVSDAILASSSLPFVFPPRALLASEGGLAHTLVDGGVWSNFPMFVFNDKSFRKVSKRDERINEEYVVGYLLDEKVRDDIDFENCRFVSLGDKVEAAERQAPPETEKCPEDKPFARIRDLLDGAGGWLIRVIAFPLWLADYLSLNDSRAWRGRWRYPEGTLGGLLNAIDRALGTLHSVMFGGVAAVLLTVGAGLGIKLLWAEFFLGAMAQLRSDYGPNVALFALDLAGVLIAIVSIVLVAAIWFLVMAGLIGNFAALGTVRTSFFGIARTYLAGPGAPPWAGASEMDFVARLEIPSCLTTTSFDRTKKAVQDAIAEAIEKAELTTATLLDRVLATTPNRRSNRRKVEPVEVKAAEASPPAHLGIGWELLRTGLLVGGSALLVFAVFFVAGQPARREYQVDIAVCTDVLETAEEACSPAVIDKTAVTVSFGPKAIGHQTQARFLIGDVDKHPNDPESNNGTRQIEHMVVDWKTLCPAGPCDLRIEALVDSRVVERRTIHLTQAISWR